MPAAIYATDADGTIRYFNRAAAELAGREPVLGKDKWCVTLRLHKLDGSPLPHDECPMAIALREGRAVRGAEAIAERPDGTRFPFIPYPTPIFDRSGKVIGAVNMLVDVSEQRQARREVGEGAVRYRGIFEGARVALWDQDFSPLIGLLDQLRAEGVTDIRAYFEGRPEALAEAVALVHVRDVNSYAVELFEAEDKEGLLGALGATFLPESHSVFLEEIVALWNGAGRFESEAVVQTLKGRRLDILITIAWNGERGERSLISILDISKQKAAQRRFETLNRIGRTLSSEQELERIVQLVTDSATDLSGAKFGAFFYNVVDQQGESFTLYAISGASRSDFERFGLPRNTAVFEPTFRGTGVVRSDDIRLDPRYGKSEPHYGMPKGHLPVVSYLAVPVVSRSGEVHGGLFFGHDQPGAFNQDAEDIVTGIASHAAIAIDNARLLQAMQDEVQRRRRAEESQRHLVSIVESSDDAIASKNLDGTLISWNRGAERLFGYSADEIIGKSVTVLIPQDHQNEEPEIINRIRRGERVEHYDTVRRRKDGTLIDISLSISPVRDADGRIVGASKIARDISQRKRAENALAERMEEQAALYDFTRRLNRAESLGAVYAAALDAIARALQCSRAAILLFDESGVMRFVAWRGLSDAYRRAVDGHSPWTPDAVNFEPIAIDDIARSDLEASLKATIRQENIGALAFIPLEAKGRLIGKFMVYRDTAHRFGSAEVDLAQTIARQLGFSIERMRVEAARTKAEEELRRSERSQQLALRAGRMGAWEWNVASGEMSWSAGLEEIHGLAIGSFGGRFEDFKRGIHPDDRDRVLAEFKHAVDTDSDVHALYRVGRKDGEMRWLEAFGSIAPGNDGKPTLAGVCMDVTERKQAEAEHDLLVAELSHRVKNTLATVISVAHQSFAKGPSADEARATFQARIRALAQTHGRLAEASWAGVPFETILLDELAPYRGDDNVIVSGPSVSLSPRCALTLGMALHELATNAAKYGALSAPSGSVAVKWQVEPRDRLLRISWSEAGGPKVTAPARSGFGRLLLERVVAADLKGDVRLDFSEAGLRCDMTIPLAEHAPHVG